MDRKVITTFVEAIWHTPLDTAIQLSSTLINDRLPHEYLATLNNEDRLEALRACLIISLLTDSRVVPCVFQLQASLEMLHQRDCVVIAGTSSGKTLCLLIPALLRPDSISITISPLKRLQTIQVR
ncbi:hypothetical protein L210DRAFT_3420065 [Boletus edulis BED1]|uniref:DEAD/DEAH-box helicase domain-containing protein n=1 Tax=Boletus edulis BED1 TaxID=1328754 RepID=A0AAD4BGK3_BOLED|nr:hypothetical protein L210DRAFT_3420065 [Boletus edulis BED1]